MRPSGYSSNVYVLTFIEPMVAIICACLPVIHTLLARIYNTGMGIRTLQSLLRSRTGTSTSQSKENSGYDSNHYTDGSYTNESFKSSIHKGNESMELPLHQPGSEIRVETHLMQEVVTNP